MRLQRKITQILLCALILENFKNHSKPRKINLEEDKVYEGEELKILHRKLVGPIKEEFSQPESLDSLGTVWGKLYNRELLTESDNKFIDLKEIGTAEDTLFNFMVFKNIKKLSFIDKCFYHYWKENEGSITSKYNPNIFEQWKNLFKYMENFIKENNLNENFLEALNNRICIGVLGIGLNQCKEDNEINTLNKVKNLKQVLNDSQMRKAYSNLELKYFPVHWKIFYCFNKYRMALPSYMMLKIMSILRKRI